MNASIVAYEDGRSITQPSAEQLAAWAFQRHLETCPQCRRGEKFCPAGQRHQDATKPDKSWIRDYETEA